MTATVHPAAAVAATPRAVARMSETVGLFAESSSAMFYVTRALQGLETAPYCRFSAHYGSMGHALAGALGFCATTGQRAVVVTGDGSFHLLNPLATAVKHGFALTIVVLNDARLGLPWFGCERHGTPHAQETTPLADWDFTRQGSPLIAGRRVTIEDELEDALAEALAYPGSSVIDVIIDPTVMPPVGARMDSVDMLFGAARGTRASGDLAAASAHNDGCARP
jgi:thiamine pyrophosphate-dependent acetolactate synthase large subunit-like protein